MSAPSSHVERLRTNVALAVEEEFAELVSSAVAPGARPTRPPITGAGEGSVYSAHHPNKAEAVRLRMTSPAGLSAVARSMARARRAEVERTMRARGSAVLRAIDAAAAAASGHDRGSGGGYGPAVSRSIGSSSSAHQVPHERSVTLSEPRSAAAAAAAAREAAGDYTALLQQWASELDMSLPAPPSVRSVSSGPPSDHGRAEAILAAASAPMRPLRASVSASELSAPAARRQQQQQQRRGRKEPLNHHRRLLPPVTSTSAARATRARGTGPSRLPPSIASFWAATAVGEVPAVRGDGVGAAPIAGAVDATRAARAAAAARARQRRAFAGMSGGHAPPASGLAAASLPLGDSLLLRSPRGAPDEAPFGLSAFDVVSGGGGGGGGGGGASPGGPVAAASGSFEASASLRTLSSVFDGEHRELVVSVEMQRTLDAHLAANMALDGDGIGGLRGVWSNAVASSLAAPLDAVMYARRRGGGGDGDAAATAATASPDEGDGDDDAGGHDAGARFFRSGTWRSRPTPLVYEPGFLYSTEAQAAAGAIGRAYRHRLQRRVDLVTVCQALWRGRATRNRYRRYKLLTTRAVRTLQCGFRRTRLWNGLHAAAARVQHVAREWLARRAVARARAARRHAAATRIQATLARGRAGRACADRVWRARVCELYDGVVRAAVVVQRWGRGMLGRRAARRQRRAAGRLRRWARVRLAPLHGGATAVQRLARGVLERARLRRATAPLQALVRGVQARGRYAALHGAAAAAAARREADERTFVRVSCDNAAADAADALARATGSGVVALLRPARARVAASRAAIKRVPPDARRRAIVDETFALFDSDGSGSIDAGELRSLVNALCIAMTDEDLARAMREIDSDGSGSIDVDEFYRWYTGAGGGSDDEEASVDDGGGAGGAGGGDGRKTSVRLSAAAGGVAAAAPTDDGGGGGARKASVRPSMAGGAAAAAPADAGAPRRTSEAPAGSIGGGAGAAVVAARPSDETAAAASAPVDVVVASEGAAGGGGGRKSSARSGAAADARKASVAHSTGGAAPTAAVDVAVAATATGGVPSDDATTAAAAAARKRSSLIDVAASAPPAPGRKATSVGRKPIATGSALLAVRLHAARIARDLVGATTERLVRREYIVGARIVAAAAARAAFRARRPPRHACPTCPATFAFERAAAAHAARGCDPRERYPLPSPSDTIAE